MLTALAYMNTRALFVYFSHCQCVRHGNTAYEHWIPVFRAFSFPAGMENLELGTWNLSSHRQMFLTWRFTVLYEEISRTREVPGSFYPFGATVEKGFSKNMDSRRGTRLSIYIIISQVYKNNNNHYIWWWCCTFFNSRSYKVVLSQYISALKPLWEQLHSAETRRHPPTRQRHDVNRTWQPRAAMCHFLSLTSQTSDPALHPAWATPGTGWIIRGSSTGILQQACDKEK